jgi:uncharacterized protein DUF2703
MKIELLHIADCPNLETARRLLKEALRERGLAEEISEIAVADPAQAEGLRFPGSPTIRVNGNDIETGLSNQGGYGISCRTYIVGGTRQGVPSREMIREAILSAISPAHTGTKES